MIKLLIAEDHNIVRKGIRSLLEQVDGVKVVGEASCGSEVLEIIESGTQVDLVLLDLNMPGINGLELISTLTGFPGIKVVVLSMVDSEQYAIQAYHAGVKGYLLKSVTHEELIFSIRHVASGHPYVCSDMVSKILSGIESAGKPAPVLNTELSRRELEVLALIADGYTNLEIAEKLFMSRRTVEGHRQNLLEKTGTKNTATLIRYALRNQLID
ncbi:MAG TPA: response regulator transcription factor [Sphingobacteriaceae bacterium]